MYIPVTTTAEPSRSVETAPLLWRASSLGYQINHLARLFEAALRARIAPYGVAPGQFAQLLALYERDGISQVELCEAVQIEQPTMANTLRRMERDGLVTRVPSSSDRRRTQIWLTPHARSLEPTLAACATEINDIATRELGGLDPALLLQVLKDMIRNLEVHTEETGS